MPVEDTFGHRITDLQVAEHVPRREHTVDGPPVAAFAAQFFVAALCDGRLVCVDLGAVGAPSGGGGAVPVFYDPSGVSGFCDESPAVHDPAEVEVAGVSNHAFGGAVELFERA